MFRRLNQLPELGVLLEGFIFLHLQAGTEEEILESMAIEDAMDEQAQFVALEIDAVIADPEAVQGAACPFEFAEGVQFGLHHLLGQAAKLAEDLELEFLGHAGQLSRAGRIKDDLERTHWYWGGSAYGNRTRLSALRGPCPNR